jgi:5-formyltetrahydrofolate cyclo-ligase
MNCQVITYIVITVAHSIAGYRIGKGKGYADLEFAMLVKMGAVNQNTVLAATVHDCQVHIQSWSVFNLSSFQRLTGA